MPQVWQRMPPAYICRLILFPISVFACMLYVHAHSLNHQHVKPRCNLIGTFQATSSLCILGFRAVGWVGRVNICPAPRLSSFVRDAKKTTFELCELSYPMTTPETLEGEIAGANQVSVFMASRMSFTLHRNADTAAQKKHATTWIRTFSRITTCHFVLQALVCGHAQVCSSVKNERLWPGQITC